MSLCIFIHTAAKIPIVDIPIKATKHEVFILHISPQSALGSILDNKHMTFDPNYPDLPKNEPLKGNFAVNIHSPTNFGEGQPKDTGEVMDQTDKQTNYSMMQNAHHPQTATKKELNGNFRAKTVITS